jgi:RNA polymerase sigma-70 factor (ECF subfamily)
MSTPAPAGNPARTPRDGERTIVAGMADHGDDLRLVERMLGGDAAAYAAFAERYLPALYRFTRSRLGRDHECTRDLVQTAITKALARLHTYRGDAALLTWLCACCRNEVLMHFRAARSAPRELELVDGVEPAAGFRPPTGGNPEAALLRLETARQVHMTLDLLPVHYAQALEWKYVEGASMEQIAGRMGASAKAVESLLTRARAAFRSQYQGVRTATAPPAPEDREEPDRGRPRAAD